MCRPFLLSCTTKLRKARDEPKFMFIFRDNPQNPLYSAIILHNILFPLHMILLVLGYINILPIILPWVGM